ncbi:MAG: translation initiation factor IF-2 subunit beta [Candidatus Bathyarchaeia archaeon]
MNKDFKELLEWTYEKVPEIADKHERFNVSRAEIQFSGCRTVIIKFSDIADQLRRNSEHILKFLAGETATRDSIKEGRSVFQGRFDHESINNLLKLYTYKYVLCFVCGRPDTHLEGEKRQYFLKYEACGARSSLGSG